MSLTIEHVGYRIGDELVLDDIELEVPSGAMVGLVGPNGSGKSTLLRLLAGTLTPQTGIVWLDDERLWELDRRRAAELVVTIVPDGSESGDAADRDGTVGDLLSTAGGEGGAPMLDELLQAGGLSELRHRRLDQLSRGERQRAVVGIALLRRPSVLLMDDPLGGVDVRHRHQLLRFVRRLAVTAVVATGDLELVAAYCDRVVVLERGRITAAGTAAEVLQPGTIGATPRHRALSAGGAVASAADQP